MEFKELIDKVKEFSDVFEIKINSKPSNVDFSDFYLRHALLAEENNEYFEACTNRDVIEIADALGDQLYIVLGTILKHGMQDVIVDVFNLIHENNMSKLHDGEVVRNENGKVMKPANFKAVDLTKIIHCE